MVGPHALINDESLCLHLLLSLFPIVLVNYTLLSHKERR